MANRSLVIACGALAREIQQLKKSNGWDHLDIECLSASLHNTPARIPGKIAEKLDAVRGQYEKILIAYADCGTSGAIDQLIEAETGVSRLPGAHCFAGFVGLDQYTLMMDEQPGTFWLSDFLVRHFQTMVVQTLKLDDHPELKALYFGNYQRVVFISQTRDDALLASACDIADYLGLAFDHHPAGYGEIEQSLKWCAA